MRTEPHKSEAPAKDVTPYTTSAKEVALYKSVHVTTITRWCKAERIPSIFEGGEWKILTEWFVELKHREAMARARYIRAN